MIGVFLGSSKEDQHNYFVLLMSVFDDWQTSQIASFDAKVMKLPLCCSFLEFTGIFFGGPTNAVCVWELADHERNRSFQNEC